MRERFTVDHSKRERFTAYRANNEVEIHCGSKKEKDSLWSDQ